MRDTKIVGDISENMVVVELLKLGLNVLKPIGDRLPYDLAVDIDGRLIRIQIKTVYFVKDKNTYVGTVRKSKISIKGHSHVKCNTTNVEYFVYVLQPENIFYILPSSLICLYKSNISFCPHKKRKRNKDNIDIESYKNNWTILNS